jgi:LmbE family N-acetylglucosaminyl deacetylase
MPQENARPNVVFVVGHPDDVALSFGGTAWLLKDLYKLHVLCASKGERGYHYDGAGLAPPSQEVGATREREEQQSCAMLGAELTFLGQTDGEIFAGCEVCQTVAAMLTALKPAAVFTHCPFEKPDHAAVYGIATHSLHLAKLFWTTEIYMPVGTGSEFNNAKPDVYVNISSVIEQKRALIRCHKRHSKTEAEVEEWIAPNRHLGRLAWCDYAEAFASALPMVAERWKREAGSILMRLPVSRA